MLKKFKEIIIGKSLKSSELKGEKLNIFWGLPIMASDAISSVAYAIEEILIVLFSTSMLVGTVAFKYEVYVAIGIVCLLVILVISYRQTIDAYPKGGGSYTVASANLGIIPGLIACSSLVMGYILTVAVSNASATAAITSAIPSLIKYKVYITVGLIILMTIGNLRGVKDSAKIFAVPTYIFILSMLVLILTGIFKIIIFHDSPSTSEIQGTTSNVSIFLILHAFAAGCSGLTGVEAISNAVPNFKEPSQKNAKKILFILAIICAVIFLGISYLTSHYHIKPNSNGETVLSMLAAHVFGNGIIYYIIQLSTVVVLAMAANTSFAGLPLLLYSAASDGYIPRQFAARGTRLGFSNGIIALGIVSSILVIIFNANTHNLIPLYAVGVFISFTLSQFGMLSKWLHEKGEIYKIIINGTGSIVTFIIAVTIAYNNFLNGAWITLALIVAMVIYMRATKQHYNDTAKQLYLAPEEIQKESESIYVVKRLIVVVNDLNKSSLKAINYARQMAHDQNLVAFHVSMDENRSKNLKEKWEYYKMNIPLVIRYTPYRDVIETLANYIQSEESNYGPNDMITVVIPQFVVSKSWHNLYHNQTAFNIRRKLLRDRHIAVISVPYVLDNNKLKTKSNIEKEIRNIDENKINNNNKDLIEDKKEESVKEDNNTEVPDIIIDVNDKSDEKTDNNN